MTTGELLVVTYGSATVIVIGLLVLDVKCFHWRLTSWLWGLLTSERQEEVVKHVMEIWCFVMKAVFYLCYTLEGYTYCNSLEEEKCHE